MVDYTLNPHGKKVTSDLVFWCTGTIPNTSFLSKHFGDFLTKNGLVQTNEFFQLGSEEPWSHIFAIGDCTAWRVRHWSCVKLNMPT
jgi:NADH dehydrogenase FAD-containing subunit